VESESDKPKKTAGINQPRKKDINMTPGQEKKSEVTLTKHVEREGEKLAGSTQKNLEMVIKMDRDIGDSN